MAAEKGYTPSQLALAWVLSRGQDIVPIFGTKRRKYLLENLKALEIRLSAEDLRRIEELAPKGAVAGDRYPAAMMGYIGRVANARRAAATVRVSARSTCFHRFLARADDADHRAAHAQEVDGLAHVLGLVHGAHPHRSWHHEQRQVHVVARVIEVSDLAVDQRAIARAQQLGRADGLSARRGIRRPSSSNQAATRPGSLLQTFAGSFGGRSSSRGRGPAPRTRRAAPRAARRRRGPGPRPRAAAAAADPARRGRRAQTPVHRARQAGRHAPGAPARAAARAAPLSKSACSRQSGHSARCASIVGALGPAQRAVHEAGDAFGVAAHGFLPPRAVAQEGAPAVDARHDGADRHVQDARDLLVAEVLDVAQHHGGAEHVGQAGQRALEVLAALGQRVLGRRHAGPVVGHLDRPRASGATAGRRRSARGGGSCRARPGCCCRGVNPSKAR